MLTSLFRILLNWQHSFPFCRHCKHPIRSSNLLIGSLFLELLLDWRSIPSPIFKFLLRRILFGSETQCRFISYDKEEFSLKSGKTCFPLSVALTSICAHYSIDANCCRECWVKTAASYRDLRSKEKCLSNHKKREAKKQRRKSLRLVFIVMKSENSMKE